MLTFLIDRLLNDFSSRFLSQERKNQIAVSITEYLDRLYNRIRLTKTILSKEAPVNFYDTYVPLTLKNKDISIRIRNPSEVLNEYKFLAIIGSAGCGKTTLLRYITLKSIDEGYAIPINLELRHYDSDTSLFEDFVSKQINTEYYNDIKLLFKKGGFVFILDGFDEINYKEGQYLIEQVEKFIDTYSNNIFIISSRPGTNLESLPRFYVFNIEPLNFYDIDLLLDKLSISTSIKKAVNDIVHKDEFFKNYLTNPLFLSLYIKYINSNTDKRIPHRNSLFFRNVLDSLLSNHDAVSKLGYIRTRLSGLGKDQIESIASTLAFRAFISSQYEFYKDSLYKEFEIIKRAKNISFDNEKLTYDLTITTNILVENNNSFYFPHVLFLEYLASLFISKIEPSIKSKFYSNVLERGNLLLSVSVLNFLYELDRVPFIEHLLIPSTELYMEGSAFLKMNPFYNYAIEEFFKQNFREVHNYNSHSTIIEILQSLKYEVANKNDNNWGELFQF